MNAAAAFLPSESDWDIFDQGTEEDLWRLVSSQLKCSCMYTNCISGGLWLVLAWVVVVEEEEDDEVDESGDGRGCGRGGGISDDDDGIVGGGGSVAAAAILAAANDMGEVRVQENGAGRSVQPGQRLGSSDGRDQSRRSAGSTAGPDRGCSAEAASAFSPFLRAARARQDSQGSREQQRRTRQAGNRKARCLRDIWSAYDVGWEVAARIADGAKGTKHGRPEPLSINEAPIHWNRPGLREPGIIAFIHAGPLPRRPHHPLCTPPWPPTRLLTAPRKHAVAAQLPPRCPAWGWVDGWMDGWMGV